MTYSKAWRRIKCFLNRKLKTYEQIEAMYQRNYEYYKANECIAVQDALKEIIEMINDLEEGEEDDI